VLHEERYTLVAAPGRLASTPLRGPRDASAHALLDLSPERPLFRYFLDGRPAGEVWNFDAVARLGTIAAVRAEVLRGRGIAVLPRYFCKQDLARGRLVEPLPRAKLSVDHFRLVFRADHPRALELAELGRALRAAPLR
jgi:DNA-binding transcriptional LysR family regulator